MSGVRSSKKDEGKRGKKERRSDCVITESGQEGSKPRRVKKRRLLAVKSRQKNTGTWEKWERSEPVTGPIEYPGLANQRNKKNQ